jgi:hypothetical protein
MDNDLNTHIAVCNERYHTLSEKLDGINDRLDKLNGRWWKILYSSIGVLLMGLASTIAYIWVNSI